MMKKLCKNCKNDLWCRGFSVGSDTSRYRFCKARDFVYYNRKCWIILLKNSIVPVTVKILKKLFRRNV